MKIRFRHIRLSKANRERLAEINSIIEEYQAQNYKLTLRQLYYQLVSRDIIANKQAEYVKISNILKEGRMAGIVDWDAIEDRLRRPQTPPSWESPSEIMDSVIYSYQLPRLAGQHNYIETWVEKDALSGVLSRVTSKYHVPILVNRGYSSISAMYDSYKRFFSALQRKQNVTILYLGDYDPSGIDMIRDIEARIIEFFSGCTTTKKGFTEISKHEIEELYDKYYFDESCFNEDDDFDSYRAYIKSRFTVTPIALTRKQINQYTPPPNPAKTTDPRSKKFIEELGDTSWEVDALRPEVLNSILTTEIESRLDLNLFEEQLQKEKEDLKQLEALKGQLR